VRYNLRVSAPLDEVAHRPWPLPRRPWVMRQVWHDLLFAHAPVDERALRAAVPAALELERFAGSTWLGVVPFRMSGVRLRGLPPLPGTHAFPELNLRTYVRHRGVPGVFFFALEAPSWLAVRVARRAFHLPYFDARLRCTAQGEDLAYEHQRTQRGAAPAALRVRYGPRGPVEPARPGTLEHFLTERYCLFAVSPAGRVWRADIHHRPWPLQPAAAEFELDTLPAAHGLDFGAPTHLRFARRLDVRIWAPRRDDR